MLPGYAELLCRSNFSFLTGASHPEELVARAHALGYAALAITDECSLAGVVRAHAEGKRCGLHVIVGAQMQLHLPTKDAKTRGAPHARLALLAMSRRGYGNLSQWVTVARRRAEKGEYLAHPSDIEGRVPNAPVLAGLPDCLALLLPQATQSFEAVFAQAMWLKTWFGDRAAIGVALLHRTHDVLLLELVQRVAALTGLAVVAVGDVLMHLRSRKPLQDALTATRLGLPVAQCGLALEPNAEAHLRPRARLATTYPHEWLDATLALAGRCAFSLDELRYEYPREIVPDGHTPASWLRSLTEEGAARRFPAGVPAKVLGLIEHELALIAQLQYEPYFLTVADIVHWARAQGILCQGRGSAANSAVCYCLGVTEVDPARMSVLFERFISAERNEPPDIDVDFEHQRREEVIQYIYRKYGRHRAALTAVVISYRPRSALRDAGRALGFDLAAIDVVAKSQHWFDGRRIDPERLRENGFDPGAPLVRLWIEITQQLIGFPRHLSQHPGGFVIARDDLARLVPVENAAMPNRTVIQWDKDDLDALGLLKVDILALGMLSAIKRALVFIGQKLDTHFEMQQVPAEDPATYDMLCRADSVGTFQVESRAQMSMLPRLKPRKFYDLVIEVAIVRPGPIQGGMVHPYLKRRNGEEAVEFPSAEVAEALARTCGVPIFQEQVMQLAVLAADFTPGEADSLRRAMAAWKRKGGLGPFHQRLVGRMVEKGYSEEYAERIFKQIQGFGEYGFPESHAASFALLAYVSAWIKCHHPDAFLAALLNSQPMGFYAPAQLVRDAREHGVSVLPVDVTVSEWESALEFSPSPVTGESRITPSPLTGEGWGGGGGGAPTPPPHPNLPPQGGKEARPSSAHVVVRGGAKQRVSTEHRDFARSLRGAMTDAEQKLWWHLRQHQIDGARFRRQVPVGDCVLDFVCLDKRVVVEVDGGQHADRQAHDAARSAWLEAQGFQVLRFWNNEVMGNLEGVLTVVQQALRSRESTSRALNERRASPPPRPEARPNMAEPLRRHEAALREPPPTPPVKGEGANPAPPPTKAARIPPSPLTGEGRGGGGRMTPAGTASAGPLTGEVWDGGDSQRSNPTSVHLTPVRLGLNRIVGLSQDSAERIVAARRERGFAGTEDLTRRAQLDAGDLQRLAQADALVQLTGHRHAAAWSVAGIDTRPTAMLAAMPSCERPIHNALADDRSANDDGGDGGDGDDYESDHDHDQHGNADAQPLLRPPSEAEDMLADYAALGLSLKAHPLALLRETLNPFKVQTAAVLRGYPSGRLARASGLVTHRQRPETAKGTVFVTLEDDTGAVNVIVWPNVAEAQRKPLLAATLLTVYGVWQKEGEVMHLLAHKLVDHTPLLRGLVARSRNFR